MNRELEVLIKFRPLIVAWVLIVVLYCIEILNSRYGCFSRTFNGPTILQIWRVLNLILCANFNACVYVRKAVSTRSLPIHVHCRGRPEILFLRQDALRHYFR